MKDDQLILAAATGYSLQQIQPFLASLAQTGFQGELVLIIYQKQLSSFQVGLSAFTGFQISYQFTQMGKLHYRNAFVGNWKHKLVRRSVTVCLNVLAGTGHPVLKKLALNIASYPHVGRFFEYQKAIQARPQAQKILLSDIRDVLFQASPLEGEIQGLYVGMENPAIALQDEHYNAEWIEDAYGLSVLERMQAAQISCSGVTYGDRSAMLAYINVMIEEFLRIPYAVMSNRIYDQAMHNKLLFDDRIANVNRSQPFQSNIVTLGLYPEAEILIKNGKIVNHDGSVIAIVHQYDRHIRLQQQLLHGEPEFIQP